MKKKLLLVALMIALFACLFAISISAETPQYYIEFGVKLEGNTDYTTVYVQNTEAGNPRVNLTFDFYSDVEFTQTVDKASIVAMDFSGAVHYGNSKDYVDRFTTADASVFPKCEEIKWFSRKFTTTPSDTFKNWTQLKRFDFGCAEVVDYGFLANTGIENAVISASVTELKNGVFQNCTSLKTVKILGGITKMGSNEFYGCTSLETVELGSSTVIGRAMFQNCTNLKSVSANGGQEYAVIIPEGVTSIGQQAFEKCTSIKYLSLPTTLTYVAAIAFNGCTGLEFVDFNDNKNDIEFYNYGHFQGCSGLKAVSLPDNVSILNNRIFTSCTSLKAVYLPANLVQMNTNGNGQGPFCYSTQMYFVQEPFEVRDENGNFLGDSFVMPSEPEVYYMPKTLTSAGGNVSSGTWFRDCIGLNTTIVMPEAFTKSTVVQMFRETANASNIKNVVYLGNMESIAWSERNHHINFIFANPNDKDINSFTFSSFYNNLNSNCYFYFCSTGYKYTVGVAQDKIAGTKEENSYCHITDVMKTVSTEATCTENKAETTYCFCGALIGTSEVEGTALGHEYDVANGATKQKIEYASYLAKGTLLVKCARCTECDEIDVNPIISEFKGISTKLEGDGLTFGYVIDYEALDEYVAVNGNNVELGFVVAVKAFLGDKQPLDNDGKAASDKVIKATIYASSEYEDGDVRYTGADFKLTGTWGGNADINGESVALKNVAFYMSGYIIDGGVASYIHNGENSSSAISVSYSEAEQAETTPQE